MIKRVSVIALLLIMSRGLQAQVHQVEALIRNLPDTKVYLSLYQDGEYVRVDSAGSVNGSFYFALDIHHLQGMYRIEWAGERAGNQGRGMKYIEFIWAGESFSVFADADDPGGTVIFDGSEENRVLGIFRDYELTYEQKMNALYQVLDRYPEEDSFYRAAADHFVQLQVRRDSLITGLEKQYPGLFATKIAMAYRSPVVPADLHGRERVDFLKTHFFEKAPVSNSDLLHAPVYSRRIIEYLMLYRDGQYSFSEQEEAFTDAVDIIMANVAGDRELRSFVVDYLLEGFESFGMEKIQTYIVDTYADETCSTDAVELARERVEGYRKMAEGQLAEDILIRNDKHELVKLSEVDADVVLVLFWATHCEHCMEMMPALHEWYMTDRPENVEIFAVSIDTAATAWQQYSMVTDPPWINTREPMGWEGKSAEDYNIYATPTMFLLDHERKIIARPFTLRELRREIRRL